MSRSVKIAISLPEKDFKELENQRIKEGVSRSKFILQTLKTRKEEMEKQKLIKMYVEGYKKMPENPSEIKAREKASLKVFSEGDW